MSIKKTNTKKKHEEIYAKIENLLQTRQADSILEASIIVSRKVRMTPQSVSGAYYNMRKMKSTQRQNEY